MPVKLVCTLHVTGTQQQHGDVSECKINVSPGTEINTKGTTKNRRELVGKYFGQNTKEITQVELQIPEHNVRENCFFQWFFFFLVGWAWGFFGGGGECLFFLFSEDMNSEEVG